MDRLTLTLFLCFLAMAALLYWGSRRSDTLPWHRTFLRGGALIILALSSLMGYVLFREIRGPEELGRYIPAYPGVRSTTWVPRVTEDRYWVFRADDDPASVARFYEDIAAGSDWTMHRAESSDTLFIQMEKEELTVSIMAIRKGKGSEITYGVSEGRRP